MVILLLLIIRYGGMRLSGLESTRQHKCGVWQGRDYRCNTSTLYGADATHRTVYIRQHKCDA
jgi:hypothetical protein